MGSGICLLITTTVAILPITFGAWSGAELTWLPVAVLVELLTGGFSYRSPPAQTDAPFSLTSSG